MEIVSEADLKFLIEKLDDKNTADERWENVIDKKNNLLSYSAKCCKPKVRVLTLNIFGMHNQRRDHQFLGFGAKDSGSSCVMFIFLNIFWL